MLYVNYASHPGLLAWMWVALVGFQAAVVWAGASLASRLGPASGARGRAILAGAALALVCLVYSWLQVQA
jgi:hypothetical protein